MKTDNRVLYFSLNPKSVDSFYSFLDQSGIDCQCSFRAIDKEQILDKENNALKFKHATDLLCFLDEFSKVGDLGCLYVIIDYPSFFNNHFNEKVNEKENHGSPIELEKTNELESFSVKDAAKSIRHAILQYPEVFFMFDESWNQTDKDAENENENQPKKTNELDFSSFLFYFDQKEKEYINIVWIDYHKYAVKKGDNPFDAILRGRTSLFDGSNLRYAIKRYEYDALNVNRHNFSLIQDSRAENLAICVEEEHSQNRFNSYALYANGFRVLPVVTAKELLFFNTENCKISKPAVIVRDFDLQFPDTDGFRMVEIPEPIEDKKAAGEVATSASVPSSSITPSTATGASASSPCSAPQPSYVTSSSTTTDTSQVITMLAATKETAEEATAMPVESLSGEKKKYKIYDIDFIRGVKKWEPKDGSKEYKDKKDVPEEYKDKWYVFRDNHYWNNLKDIPTFFVSKGVADIEFCGTTVEYREKLGILKKTDHETIPKGVMGPFQDQTEKQIVQGIKKPVSGLYCPFHFFGEIKKRYNSFKISNETAFIIREAQKLSNDKRNQCNDAKKQLKNFVNEKYYLGGRWLSERRLWNVLKKTGIDKKVSLAEDVYNEGLKTQAWIIDTSRENHDHGVPLDVYDIVQNMLKRAKTYYETENFIKAAIISSEAIELLNGFHEALMLQAYHILAISENAIAMNAIGGNEMLLKKDAIFRINKIEHEVGRLLKRAKVEGQTKADRRELKFNVLNQIFSDCRKMCKDKEHFDVEDCFISAMAYVNEGFTLCDIWFELTLIITRIKNSWQEKRNNLI